MSVNLDLLDADQRRLVQRLSTLGSHAADGAAAQVGARGLYVHGGVGRGKTWLCDTFFEASPGTAKLRVHFHAFFLRLHRTIWSIRSRQTAARADGTGHDATGEAAKGADVIELAIAELLNGVDLLYFDEFHVHDSGDAALITRLLEAVFARDITVLLTSNYAPDDLLPNPNYHDLFEPAIALITLHLEVVELGGSVDYRRVTRTAERSGFTAGRWIAPADAGQLEIVGLQPPLPAERRDITAGGHRFSARRASDGEIWFDFADLCEAHTSVSDYLAWVADYDLWIVEGVPLLADAPVQARQRFSHLIDVLTDHDVTLHILSAHSPAAVVSARNGEDTLADAARTASRLALLQPLAR